MKRISKNERGLGSLELFLAVLFFALVVGIGWYIWRAGQDKTPGNTQTSTATQTPTTDTKSTKPSSTSAESQVTAIEAMKAYCTKMGMDSCDVVINRTSGNFVMASLHDTSPDGPGTGSVLISEMSSEGTWAVDWNGQSTPTKTDAQKYGFPDEWGAYQ